MSALPIDSNEHFKLAQFHHDVQSLVKKGLRVVPIPAGEKSPKGNGWPALEIKADEVATKFPAVCNVGVILGHNGLTDIDKDCEEAVLIAPMFLPETGMEFGRQSARAAHSLYFVDAGEGKHFPTRQFKDPLAAKDQGKAVIIEIRGTKRDGTLGMRTVFPPSVHPSGERIKFEPGRDRYPQNIDAVAINCTPKLPLVFAAGDDRSALARLCKSPTARARRGCTGSG